MNEKHALYSYCRDYVQQRKAGIQEEIKNAQLSANQETKGTAGDKYETGRAMAQLEVERNMTQLREVEKLETVLNSISQEVTIARIRPGALVSTSKGIFYIAISLGQVKLNNKNYFVVSVDSPIGKLLLNKQTGDSIAWNGFVHVIDRVE